MRVVTSLKIVLVLVDKPFNLPVLTRALALLLRDTHLDIPLSLDNQLCKNISLKLPLLLTYALLLRTSELLVRLDLGPFLLPLTVPCGLWMTALLTFLRPPMLFVRPSPRVVGHLITADALGTALLLLLLRRTADSLWPLHHPLAPRPYHAMTLG